MTKKKEKFVNPASTATVLVEKDGKILLVRRKHEPYQGQFCMPGGYLNCGKETLERTAQRELYEETRLRVRQRDLYVLCINSKPNRDPRGHVIDHVYLAQKFRGQPRAGDDAASFKWFPYNRLPKRLAFDHGKVLKRWAYHYNLMLKSETPY